MTWRGRTAAGGVADVAGRTTSVRETSLTSNGIGMDVNLGAYRARHRACAHDLPAFRDAEHARSRHSVPSELMSLVAPADRYSRSLLRARSGARRQGWLVLLVGALAAGIFGMHALGSHGTPGPAARPATDVTGGAVASSTAAMTTMTTAGVRDGAASPGDAHMAHEGHDATSMVVLCVVMLAAAAVTLLVLLAGGLVRALLPDTFAPAAVRPRAPSWVRGAGPPPEWQFSVIRC